MKVVPDYLEGYLDTERLICLLLFLVVLWVGYDAYKMQTTRSQVQQQAQSFARKLPQYQQLRRKILKKRSPDIAQNIENNPLSYLERVVPDKHLTNLKPIDQGEGDYRFELRVESTDIKTALLLLSNFEKESQLTVTEFTLIRKSLESLEFHSILRIQLVV